MTGSASCDMKDKLSMNTITLKTTPFGEKLSAITAAGFRKVELWSDELQQYAKILKSARIAETSALLPKAETVCPVPTFYPWHYELNDKLASDFNKMFELSALVRARCIIMPIIGSEGNESVTAGHIDELCVIAKQYDLNLGIEFIGANGKLNTLESIVNLLGAVNSSNCGVVIDLFHLYRGNSDLEMLSAINPAKISIVHIDDAMPLPKNELVGTKHRVLPGDGVIPIRYMLDQIRSTGYDGSYAVELFNEEYWAQDPESLCRSAFNKSMQFLEV